MAFAVLLASEAALALAQDYLSRPGGKVLCQRPFSISGYFRLAFGSEPIHSWARLESLSFYPFSVHAARERKKQFSIIISPSRLSVQVVGVMVSCRKSYFHVILGKTNVKLYDFFILDMKIYILSEPQTGNLGFVNLD